MLGYWQIVVVLGLGPALVQWLALVRQLVPVLVLVLVPELAPGLVVVCLDPYKSRLLIYLP